jgi:hypothetical protein
MMGPRLRDYYLALRQWTDDDIANRRFRISWINWPLPFLPGILLNAVGLPGAGLLALPAAVLSLVWLGFNIWRGVRVLRASAAYGDWQYDKRDRTQLASEYADGISATRARVRAKLAKSKQRRG